MNIHLVLLLTDFRFSPGFWVISYLRTPIRESIPHSDSTSLSNFSLLTSSIILQVIPSLISYIIIVLNFLTVLSGPYSRSTTFRRWGKLTSIFLILSFHLEQQAWIRAYVVFVAPIAFASSFLLLDDVAARWHLHRASQQNLSWSPSIYCLVVRYQSNSWGEIPSLPVDDSCCHRHYPWLPANIDLVMF